MTRIIQPDGEQIIMHIDADAFFASVEQGFNPVLKGKPVIVGGSADQRGVVHTASYEARLLGIKTGMSLSKAKRICPRGVFIKGDFEHYQAVSQVMRSIYLQYTPKIEFTSLDDAYLDIGGSSHLYSSLFSMAQMIQHQVKSHLGFTVSIGIGSTKLVSRIASGLYKPSGIFWVKPGSELDFLSPLPVTQLPGIGPIIHEKLIELGIFSITDLQKLSLLTLTQLFGTNGERYWELARGIDKRVVKAKIAPSQISRETTFEEDQNDQNTILATLQYLTERIAQKLYDTDLTAKKIGIKIRYSDFGQQQMQSTLPYPTYQAAELFNRVRTMFSKLFIRRMRIRHVGVQVGNLRWNQYQLQMFNDQQKAELLNSAVNSIRERYGFMSIIPADSLILKKKYRMDKSGYILHSPALTR